MTRERKMFLRRASEGADDTACDTEHPTRDTVSLLLWLAFIPPGESLFVRLSGGKNSLTTHTLCQTDQSQQGTLGDSTWLMKHHLVARVKTERGFWLWILADICWTRFIQPDGMWQCRMVERPAYKSTEVPPRKIRLDVKGPPLVGKEQVN